MTNMKSQNKLVKERTPKQTNRRNKESKPHYSNEFNTSFFKCEPTKLQKGVLNFFRQNEISIITGDPGTGKDFVSLYFALEMLRAGSVERILITKPIVEIGKSIGFLPGPQPLDAKVLTPTGWKTMGEISVGDYVIARDGTPSKVKQTLCFEEQDIYNVHTLEGTTQSTLDHLWLTKTKEELKRGKEGKVKTLREIKESFFNNRKKGIKFNHILPRNNCVIFQEQRGLPLDPYLLGVLLGDGSLSNHLSISNIDQELIERVRSIVEKQQYKLNCNGGISYTISKNFESNNKTARRVKITNMIDNSSSIYRRADEAYRKLGIHKSILKHRCETNKIVDNIKYEYLPPEGRWTNIFKQQLEDLGLLNCWAGNKFVPNMYKYGSVNTRLEILRGLMDTDGTIKKNGEASFTTISKQLALDVREIVKSLGGRSELRSRDRIGQESFHGNRKIISRHISYEYNISLPEDLNPFFISRKAERHSCAYIHNNYITDITFAGRKKVKCIVIDNPEHLYITDDYIVTHNSSLEKYAPYEQSFIDNLQRIVGTYESNSLLNGKKISFQPINFVRGSTFRNAVVILSEAQNCTLHELVSFTTRVADDSKLLINGDLLQADIKNSGLKKYIELFSNIEGIDYLELGPEFQMRSKLIVDINRIYRNYLNQ